jgi:hypothetical protein
MSGKKTHRVWVSNNTGNVRKRKIEALSCNHCYCRKEMSIIYSECVSVALDIQHAKCMRRITSSSVACLVIQYFSTLSHTCYDFRKKKMNENDMPRFSLNILPETFIILTRTERDIIINVRRSLCEVPVVFDRI